MVLGIDPKTRTLWVGYIIFLSPKETFFKPSVSHLQLRGNQSFFKNISGIEIEKNNQILLQEMQCPLK